MMGIRLDWEIETEHTVDIHSAVDLNAMRKRRTQRVRLFIGIMSVIAVCGLLYGVVYWRLTLVDREIKQALRDTVEAEVTTLRIADRPAFLNIQRSASDIWAQNQTLFFDSYQQLKLNYDLQLTGNIVALDVDGTRGRVQVEEIINGTPYVQTWFYWRYNDGWRHVPPDFTYWGDVETIERDLLTVRYNSVDQPLAEALAPTLSDWLTQACDALTCGDLPLLEVEIIPQPGLPVSWDETNIWLLRVPSPFTGRARLDRPFDLPLQQEIAELLAVRLLEQTAGTTQPAYPADAYFLYDAAREWLVGRFIQQDTASYLLSSYAARYGNNTLGVVIRQLQPQSDLRLLNNPAGVFNLNELAVDWRDYLQWRLTVEQEMRRQRVQATYFSFYDTQTPAAYAAAVDRYNTPAANDPITVLAVQPVLQPDSVPALEALVRYGADDAIRDETTLFRLIDGVWKRAN